MPKTFNCSCNMWPMFILILIAVAFVRILAYILLSNDPIQNYSQAEVEVGQIAFPCSFLVLVGNCLKKKDISVLSRWFSIHRLTIYNMYIRITEHWYSFHSRKHEIRHVLAKVIHINIAGCWLRPNIAILETETEYFEKKLFFVARFQLFLHVTCN